MENLVLFNSVQYKKIAWSTLFNSAAIAASPNKKPFGVANSKGSVLSANSILNTKIVSVCLPDDSLVNIHTAKLSVTDCSFQNGDLFAFQMSSDKINQRFISNIYMNFHNQLVYQLYRACKSMLIYTHEHLSNRHYGNKLIVKIETVESYLSEIIVLLNQVSPFILKLQSIDEVNHLLSQFLSILKIISRLSGARAVLSGNGLDLTFYVNVFQRFIVE